MINVPSRYRTIGAVQRSSCRVIQELKIISNSTVTANLPIVVVNIFIIVSNACLTVIITIILTDT